MTFHFRHTFALSVRGLQTLLLIIFMQASVNAQSWLWYRSGLKTGGTYLSYYIKVLTDHHGNTISVSANENILLSKHDTYGNLVWSRIITIPNLPQNEGITNGIRSICTDDSDNIYLLTRPLTAIDQQPVSTPGPFSLIKLNPNGRLIWSRALDYTEYYFVAPTLVSTGNLVFMSVPFQAFTTVTYDGNAYPSIAAGNAGSVWLAALDAGTGQLKWGQRMYSPALVPQCNYDGDIPHMSVNQNKDLLLTGWVTSRLDMESTTLLDSAGCVYYPYGMVLDGNNGHVKWVRKLYLDTLAHDPNLTTYMGQYNSCILSGGNAVVYTYYISDTVVGTGPNNIYHVHTLDKVYLYDTQGNLVKQASAGNIYDGWSEFYRIVPGENNTWYTGGIYFGYTPGRIGSTQLAEVTKWDSSLTRIWSKGMDYDAYYPASDILDFSYRNNAMSMIIEIAYSSGSSGYAYFGNDSIRANYQTFMAHMADSSNFISGTLFYDVNKNGIQDINEPPAAGVIIGNKKGDTAYCISHQNGSYQFFATPGSHTFKPLNLDAINHNFTLPSPGERTAELTGFGNFLRNNNFALQAPVPVTDGAISTTAYNLARPGQLLPLRTEVTNMGTTLFSGSYTLSFDTAKAIFSQSTNAPASHNGGAYTFPLSSLSPFAGTTNDIGLTLRTTTRAGDTLTIITHLNIDPDDAVPVDNADTLGLIIRSSYDPNSKEVTPFNDVNYDAVQAGTQELDYIIRFQNTGTDTAFAVILQDSLDARLDLSSFRLITSSHPVDVDLGNPRMLKFNFNNILLPDSNTNEPRSHGFVRFRIKPATTISISDKIINTANIYFDYNDAVRTNSVQSTFGKPHNTGPITGVNPVSADTSGLKCYPNPVGNTLYYTLITDDLDQTASLQIYDAAGRLVMAGNRVLRTGTINTTSLPAGVYYMELRTNKKTYLRSFIRR